MFGLFQILSAFLISVQNTICPTTPKSPTPTEFIVVKRSFCANAPGFEDLGEDYQHFNLKGPFSAESSSEEKDLSEEAVSVSVIAQCSILLEFQLRLLVSIHVHSFSFVFIHFIHVHKKEENIKRRRRKSFIFIC